MNDLIENNLIGIVLQEGQTEGSKAIVAQWLKAVGDEVILNEPIVELETDKVMMEVVAPASGVLFEIMLVQGDEVAENIILGTISPQALSKNANKLESKTKEAPNSSYELPLVKPTAGSFDPPIVFFSPAVRRLIKQHQLSVNSLDKIIVGTGKNQRITSRDVINYLKKPKTVTEQSPGEIPSYKIIHSQMRKTIAKHMLHSVQTAPHVSSVFDLDMSAIVAHRNKHKASYSAKDIKLTFTAYFIYASTKALQQVPSINSQFHQDCLEIFEHINIGIGTALGEEGLIVPVIRNCEQLDLTGIADELSSMTKKARNRQLGQKDLHGGTFTISNHGVSGSLLATPIIINQPQSAILGIGKMEKRVIVKTIKGEDTMLIKPMCYVSLTIDHRALDAHQTNAFLTHFVKTLEDWN